MITLMRYGSTPMGTFGRLRIPGTDIDLRTVERPWKGNARTVSCVPHGEYLLRWLPTTTSVPQEFDGHTWYLVGGSVGLDESSERYRVALHIGNICTDVSGCIAAGRDLGVLGGASWGVTSSRMAMLDLYRELGPRDSFISIGGLLSG